MPTQKIDLNNFSEAAAESLHYYGSYMEAAQRTDRAYYWAKLANWYLDQMGFPGRPDRAPTRDEMNGLRKIPLLRREARKWIRAELAKGRSLSDLARETPAKCAAAFRNDAEMTSAIRFMKDQLGTDRVDVALILPSFNELYQVSQGIETRSDLARLPSFHALYKYAEASETRETGRTGPTSGGEYGQLRTSEMLDYLDQYDSPDLPLEAPAVRDHNYGPAPALDNIYGPAPDMPGI